jgi:hypothetical protein
MDANRERCVFVFADSHEVVAEARVLHPMADGEGDDGQADAGVIEGDHRVFREERGHGGADVTAGDTRQVLGDEAHDFRKGDGGEAEVRAAQAEGDAADNDGRDEGGGDSAENRDPGRGALAQQGQSVGADAEEGGVAERKLSGVATNQVPGQPEGGEEEKAEDHFQEVVVTQEERGEERGCEDNGADDDLGALHARWLPKMPLGFSDSTRIKMTKSTTSAHSLPQ